MSFVFVSLFSFVVLEAYALFVSRSSLFTCGLGPLAIVFDWLVSLFAWSFVTCLFRSVCFAFFWMTRSKIQAGCRANNQSPMNILLMCLILIYLNMKLCSKYDVVKMSMPVCPLQQSTPSRVKIQSYGSGFWFWQAVGPNGSHRHREEHSASREANDDGWVPPSATTLCASHSIGPWPI